eukprot:4418765-Amphidinium_carterae.1
MIAFLEEIQTRSGRDQHTLVLLDCAPQHLSKEMQVFKPFKDYLKHHWSKSIATQVLCTADEQSLVPGLPGLKCDMLHLVSGVVRHCCASLEVRERAWKQLRGLLFDDAIPEPELDGDGGEPPPCSEAGESEPDQPWEEEEIVADIAVRAAPLVENLPSKTKDFTLFSFAPCVWFCDSKGSVSSKLFLSPSPTRKGTHISLTQCKPPSCQRPA